nr:hypothetical protein 14 [Balneolaceae bacterium]
MGKHFSKEVYALVGRHSSGSHETGGRSYSDIMDELRQALDMQRPEPEENNQDQPMEIGEDPLYEFLSEDGPCPTKDQMSKIAPVLGTSVSNLMEAAKQDGCTYQTGRTGKARLAAITRHNGSQFG